MRDRAFVLKNTKNILIINLGGIGDLLLSTGSLSALRAAMPQARIDLLAVDRVVDFMNTFNVFDNLYQLKNMHSFSAILPVLSLLRKNKYDLAVNMRTIVNITAGLKMYVLMKMIGAKTWAGRDTDGHGFFFDIKIPETRILAKPEFLYDAETIRALGIPVANPADIHVPISGTDRAAVQKLLDTAGVVPGETVIAINPGGMPSRRWGTENFIALLRLIQKSYDCKIVLTGSKPERSLCQSIAHEISAIDLSGMTESVGQLAAVLERCRLFVCNDTGSLHVDVAVGTPGIFIFGPGNPRRYAPFKEKEKHILLHNPTPCAPCDNSSCSHQTCLKSISVEDVYTAVRTLLERQVPAGGISVE
jgi:ADP-heptose:LPS heptosyltransferase